MHQKPNHQSQYANPTPNIANGDAKNNAPFCVSFTGSHLSKLNNNFAVSARRQLVVPRFGDKRFNVRHHANQILGTRATRQTARVYDRQRWRILQFFGCKRRRISPTSLVFGVSKFVSLFVRHQNHRPTLSNFVSNLPTNHALIIAIGNNETRPNSFFSFRQFPRFSTLSTRRPDRHP